MLVHLGALTAIHTALSLVALVAGIPAVIRLFGVPLHRLWTSSFLALAVLTTATGFLFPLTAITPAVVTGVIASLSLFLIFFARHAGMRGMWRWIYPAGIVANLFFLVFVAIAQTFTKNPLLAETVPALSQALFGLSELLTLAVFILIGLKAAKTFRAEFA